jgi:hypothetical protein
MEKMRELARNDGMSDILRIETSTIWYTQNLPLTCRMVGAKVPETHTALPFNLAREASKGYTMIDTGHIQKSLAAWRGEALFLCTGEVTR